MVSSRVRLMTRVRCGCQAAGVLGNTHEAGRVRGQRRGCWEVGTGSIVVRGLETVGLQDVSAHSRGKSLMVRPAVHRVMRVVGIVVVQVTLRGVRVVIMARIYFTVIVIMTRTVVVSRVGLVTVCVVEAGLVFVTLIVVLMVSCVLVMVIV